MHKVDELSRSLTNLKGDRTLIAVIEMSQLSWVVAGILPGIEREPLKKLAVDEGELLKLLNRWRQESEKARCRIERIAVAFEAGRDGFWLARCCGRTTSRPMSFTHRASPYRASTGAPRQTGSIPSYLNVLFSAGCAASGITARW
jgi:transposase